MRSVNEVTLLGNLTRDPILKTTENGQPVCTFGIATNREWKTQSGEKRSLPEFHNVVAWSRLAEKCYNNLRKGKLVYLRGYLKTRVFTNDDGSKNYRTEIVIYDMIMLDKKDSFDDDHEDINGLAMEETMQAEDEAGDFTSSLDDIEDSIDNI